VPEKSLQRSGEQANALSGEGGEQTTSLLRHSSCSIHSMQLQTAAYGATLSKPFNFFYTSFWFCAPQTTSTKNKGGINYFQADKTPALQAGSGAAHKHAARRPREATRLHALANGVRRTHRRQGTPQPSTTHNCQDSSCRKGSSEQKSLPRHSEQISSYTPRKRKSPHFKTVISS